MEKGDRYRPMKKHRSYPGEIVLNEVYNMPKNALTRQT
jgi:hypothetical protein